MRANFLQMFRIVYLLVNDSKEFSRMHPMFLSFQVYWFLYNLIMDKA
jgi:hypothetical protein